LNIYISFELKERLRLISEKYDRTTADMVRGILKIGIPIMEGISEAEESMIKEYIELFRKFRKMKDLKEI
jgi:predicted DNA-binding protein